MGSAQSSLQKQVHTDIRYCIGENTRLYAAVLHALAENDRHYSTLAECRHDRELMMNYFRRLVPHEFQDHEQQQQQSGQAGLEVTVGPWSQPPPQQDIGGSHANNHDEHTNDNVQPPLSQPRPQQDRGGSHDNDDTEHNDERQPPQPLQQLHQENGGSHENEYNEQNSDERHPPWMQPWLQHTAENFAELAQRRYGKELVVVDCSLGSVDVSAGGALCGTGSYLGAVAAQQTAAAMHLAAQAALVHTTSSQTYLYSEIAAMLSHVLGDLLGRIMAGLTHAGSALSSALAAEESALASAAQHLQQNAQYAHVGEFVMFGVPVAIALWRAGFAFNNYCTGAIDSHTLRQQLLAGFLGAGAGFFAGQGAVACVAWSIAWIGGGSLTLGLATFFGGSCAGLLGSLLVTWTVNCAYEWFFGTEEDRALDRAYERLSLKQGATLADVGRKYRKLALLHHPDKPGGSHEQFIALTRAYLKIRESLTSSDMELASADQEPNPQLAVQDDSMS